MARPKRELQKEYEETQREGKKTVEPTWSMRPDWTRARLVEMSLMADGTIEPTWSVPIIRVEPQLPNEDKQPA